MKKIEIAKKIVSSIVGIGTGMIVKQIIENNVDTNTVASKVAVGSAALVIGSAASDMTSEYTNAKIDELTDWWNKNITNRSS